MNGGSRGQAAGGNGSDGHNEPVPSGERNIYVMINRHVCALSPDEGTRPVTGQLTLREAYAWDSESETPVFLLPLSLSDVIDGTPGGGALLLYVNGSHIDGDALVESTPKTRSRRWVPIEPSVQIASWGLGSFHPLVSLAQRGPPPGEGEMWSVSPESITLGTGAGGLDIFPVADLNLASGSSPGRRVRIETSGRNGSVQVDSDVIRWVARDKAQPMYRKSSICAPGRQTAGDATTSMASLRSSLLQMDGAGLEAQASATVKLLAGKSFNIAVTGENRSASYECGGVPERAGLGSKLNLDDKAMNISAGAVRLEALNDSITVAGVDGATISSSAGTLLLQSNGGISSLSLDGNAIRGESEIVMLQASLRADATPGTGSFRPTSSQMANGESSGGRGTVGRLELNGGRATIGGAGNVAVDVEGEIRLRVENSSLVRASDQSVLLEAPRLYLRSTIPAAWVTPPPDKPPVAGAAGEAEDASGVNETIFSVVGGVVKANAAGSVELDSSGASIRLIGGRRGDDSRLPWPSESSLLASADTVEISARPAGGGSLVAQEAPGAGRRETSGHRDSRRSNTSSLGRLKVLPNGISVSGGSVEVQGSERVSLWARDPESANLQAKAEKTRLTKDRSPGSASNGVPQKSEGSRVELDDSDVQASS